MRKLSTDFGQKENENCAWGVNSVFIDDEFQGDSSVL